MSQASGPRRRGAKRRQPPPERVAAPDEGLNAATSEYPRKLAENPSYSDKLAVAVLFLTGFLILAAGARSLGFYYDDNGFLLSLPGIGSPLQLWRSMWNYVPGRNLHILWHYLLLYPFKNPVDHLTALHYIQSAADAAVVVLFNLVLRRLRLSSAASLTASALFAFWPVHGETHFWMSALPMNIGSTGLLLIFILTSVSLLQGSTAQWIYALDVLSCWGAMLTYDQVFGPLLLIIGARVACVFFYKSPAWRLLTAIHIADAAAAGFFLWLRLNAPATSSPMPFQQADFWNGIVANAKYTLGWNFWEQGAAHVRMLSQKATENDRYIALAGAIAILIVAIWLAKEKPNRSWPTHGLLFAAAVAFWVLAYIPIWMWYPAARHHYLPTVGLCCGVAVLLHLLQSVSPSRFFTAIPHLGLAAIIFISAVAARGESHYWEEAFISKRWLIEGLRSKLAGKSGLVLEGFPSANGTASLITPHDAGFAPRLLLSNLSLPPAFQGTLKARVERTGISFDPKFTVPGPSPTDLPAEQTLWLHFERVENGVLRYSEKDLTSTAFPDAR